MFSINDNFLDEGVLFAKPKAFSLTIEYFKNNNEKKVVQYDSQSDFDEALENLSTNGFVEINGTYYLISTITSVYRNGRKLEFMLESNEKVSELYDSVSDLEEVLELFDSSFIELETRKFFNGKRVNVTFSNRSALTIRYTLDGNKNYTVVYDTEADFDAALEKLAGIGTGTGGGGGARTAAPTFTPKPGIAAEGTTVTISCATEGAIIHYTTDGTIPTLDSPVYSTPITVPEEGITIKACAVILGLATSRVSVGQYKTSEFDKPYYKGWWNNYSDTLTTITANELKHLGNMEQAEATKADSPNPNIYTFPEEYYPNGGRIVWAYPAEFGEINYFTDGLGKHNITDSYTKQTVTVNDIVYFAYVLTDPIAPDAGDEYPVVFTQA